MTNKLRLALEQLKEVWQDAADKSGYDLDSLTDAIERVLDAYKKARV